MKDHDLVHSVLNGIDQAPISEAEKVLLRFIEKVNRQSNQLQRKDVERVRQAGWSDEAIFDAITVCALFNFYNRWCDANGVQDMPAEGYAASALRLAHSGYVHPHEKEKTMAAGAE